MELQLNQNDIPEHLVSEARKMVTAGADTTEISNRLAEMGADNETLGNLMEQVRKFRYIKKSRRGFALIIIGALILVAGFILTVMMYNQDKPINFVMYVPTLTGATIAFFGLVELMS